MTDAVLVVNAGSSSIKFSLFAARGNELDLVVRGQAEGLYAHPRFVAKDRTGGVVSEKSWDDGTNLGHDGALEHLTGFLRGEMSEHRLVGVGHRVVPFLGLQDSIHAGVPLGRNIDKARSINANPACASLQAVAQCEPEHAENLPGPAEQGAAGK